MPVLEFVTEIQAPIARCFDLARSIELHQQSTAPTREHAVAGTTSGLIGLNEEVTWEAVHFGVRQRLTSRITGFNAPYYFRDEMVQGAFKMIVHDHDFEQKNDRTLMRDRFEFETPFGVIGRVVNFIVLTRYLKKLLINRNSVLKAYAETSKWKLILNSNE
jgi:ligand-binding SRPBCC domain-containing protein